MRGRFFLKSVAGLLVGAFLLQDIAMAGALDALPHDISRNPGLLKFPASIAQVNEVHRGRTPRLLIHIQDAHANPSGQQNLARVLEDLVRRYGVKTVFVEGGDRNNTLSFLRPLATPEIRKQVAKKYLLKGELNGEEYLSLVSDLDFELWGVEDPRLYEENLRMYASVASRREPVLSYIDDIEKRLAALKRRFYPKDMVAFDEFLAAFERKEKDFTEYHALLTETARAYGVDLSPFGQFTSLADLREKEERVDFDEANREQAVVIEALVSEGRAAEFVDGADHPGKLKSSTVSPSPAFYENLVKAASECGISAEQTKNLAGYAEYLKAYGKVDLEAFLEETKAIEGAVFARALETADTQYLHEISRYLRGLRRLFTLQASPEEYADHKRLRAETRFDTIVLLAFVNRKLYDLGNYADIVRFSPVIDERVGEAENFYDTTLKRDQVFLDKAFRKMDSDQSRIAVLITGGFHTPHLRELMRRRGASYAIVTPVVTHETNLKRYEEILLGQLGDGNPLSRRYVESAAATSDAIRYVARRILGLDSPLDEIAGELAARGGTEGLLGGLRPVIDGEAEPSAAATLPIVGPAGTDDASLPLAGRLDPQQKPRRGTRLNPFQAFPDSENIRLFADRVLDESEADPAVYAAVRVAIASVGPTRFELMVNRARAEEETVRRLNALRFLFSRADFRAAAGAVSEASVDWPRLVNATESLLGYAVSFGLVPETRRTNILGQQVIEPASIYVRRTSADAVSAARFEPFVARFRNFRPIIVLTLLIASILTAAGGTYWAMRPDNLDVKFTNAPVLVQELPPDDKQFFLGAHHILLERRWPLKAGDVVEIRLGPEAAGETLWVAGYSKDQKDFQTDIRRLKAGEESREGKPVVIRGGFALDKGWEKFVVPSNGVVRIRVERDFANLDQITIGLQSGKPFEVKGLVAYEPKQGARFGFLRAAAALFALAVGVMVPWLGPQNAPFAPKRANAQEAGLGLPIEIDRLFETARTGKTPADRKAALDALDQAFDKLEARHADRFVARAADAAKDANIAAVRELGAIISLAERLQAVQASDAAVVAADAQILARFEEQDALAKIIARAVQSGRADRREGAKHLVRIQSRFQAGYVSEDAGGDPSFYMKNRVLQNAAMKKAARTDQTLDIALRYDRLIEAYRPRLSDVDDYWLVEGAREILEEPGILSLEMHKRGALKTVTDVVKKETTVDVDDAKNKDKNQTLWRAGVAIESALKLTAGIGEERPTGNARFGVDRRAVEAIASDPAVGRKLAAISNPHITRAIRNGIDAFVVREEEAAQKALERAEQRAKDVETDWNYRLQQSRGDRNRYGAVYADYLRKGRREIENAKADAEYAKSAVQTRTRDAKKALDILPKGARLAVLSAAEAPLYRAVPLDKLPRAVIENGAGEGLTLTEFYATTIVDGQAVQPEEGFDPLATAPSQASFATTALQSAAASSYPGQLNQFLGYAHRKDAEVRAQKPDFGKEIDASAVKVGRQSLERLARALDIVIIIGGNEGGFRDESVDMPLGLVINPEGRSGAYMYFGDSVEVTNGVKRAEGKPGTSAMMALVPLTMPVTDGYRTTFAAEFHNPEKEFPSIDPVITPSNPLDGVLDKIADYLDVPAADRTDWKVSVAGAYEFFTLDRPKNDDIVRQARALGMSVVAREDGDPMVMVRAILGIPGADGKKAIVVSTGGGAEHWMALSFAVLYGRGLLASRYVSTKALKKVDEEGKTEAGRTRLGTGSGSLADAEAWTSADHAQFENVNRAMERLRASGVEVPLGPEEAEELKDVATPESYHTAPLVQEGAQGAVFVTTITGANRTDLGALHALVRTPEWIENPDGSGIFVTSGIGINEQGLPFLYRAVHATDDVLESRYQLVAQNDLQSNPFMAEYDRTRADFRATIVRGQISPRVVRAHLENALVLLDRFPHTDAALHAGRLRQWLDEMEASRVADMDIDLLKEIVRDLERYVLGLPAVRQEDGAIFPMVKPGARLTPTGQKAIGMLQSLPEGDVLSVGISAAGAEEIEFARAGRRVVATTIDAGGALITRTAADEAGLGPDRLRVDVEDALAGFPNVPDGSVALVYARLSLHYLDKRGVEDVMKAIRRVLVPGGRAVVTVKAADDFYTRWPDAEYEPSTGLTRWKMDRRMHRRQFFTGDGLIAYAQGAGLIVEDVEPTTERLFKDYARTIPDAHESSLLTLTARGARLASKASTFAAMDERGAEFGFHTVTAARGHAGTAPGTLAEYAAKARKKGIVPALDDMSALIRFKNTPIQADPVAAFFVGTNDSLAARAIRNAADALFTDEGIDKAFVDRAKALEPEIVIFSELSVDGLDDEAIDRKIADALKTGIDGIILKPYRVRGAEKIAPGRLARIGTANPTVRFYVAGGVFQDVAGSLRAALPANMSLALGVNPAQPYDDTVAQYDAILPVRSGARLASVGRFFNEPVYGTTVQFVETLREQLDAAFSTSGLTERGIDFEVFDGDDRPMPDQTLREPDEENGRVRISKEYLDRCVEIYDMLDDPTDGEGISDAQDRFLMMIVKGLHNAALHIGNEPTDSGPGLEAALSQVADSADYREISKLIELFNFVPSIPAETRAKLVRKFLANARPRFTSYMFAFLGNEEVTKTAASRDSTAQFHLDVAEELHRLHRNNAYARKIAQYHLGAAAYETYLSNPALVEDASSSPLIEQVQVLTRALRDEAVETFTQLREDIQRHHLLVRFYESAGNDAKSLAGAASTVLSKTEQVRPFVSGTAATAGDSIEYPTTDEGTAAIRFSPALMAEQLRELGLEDLVNDQDIRPVGGDPEACIVTGKLLRLIGERNMKRVRSVVSAGGLGSRYVKREFPRGSKKPVWKEQAKGSTTIRGKIDGKETVLSFNKAKIYQAAKTNAEGRQKGWFESRADNVPVQFITSIFTHENTRTDLQAMGYRFYTPEGLRQLRRSSNREFRALLAKFGIPESVVELSETVTVAVHEDEFAPVVYVTKLDSAHTFDTRTGDFYANVDPGLSDRLLYWPLAHDASMVEGIRTGVDQILNETGKDLSFIGNIDNLAATMDPRMLGLLLLTDAQLIAESAGKEPNQKGGAPTAFKPDGFPRWLDDLASRLRLKLEEVNLTEGFEIGGSFFAEIQAAAEAEVRGTGLTPEKDGKNFEEALKGAVDKAVKHLQGEFNTANYVRNDRRFQDSIFARRKISSQRALRNADDAGTRAETTFWFDMIFRLVNARYELNKQVPSMSVSTLAGGVTLVVPTTFVRVPTRVPATRFEPKKENLDNYLSQLEFVIALISQLGSNANLDSISSAPVALLGQFQRSPDGPSIDSRLAYLKEEFKDAKVKTLEALRRTLEDKVAFERKSDNDVFAQETMREIKGARLAGAKLSARERRELKADLRREIDDLKQIVLNPPAEGPTEYQRTKALLVALAGGDVEYDTLRRDARSHERYENLRGLDEMRRMMQDKTLRGIFSPIMRRDIDRITREALRKLRERGIDRRTVGILTTNPRYQNPFIHTFVGLEGAEYAGRLDRAAQAAGFTPEDVAYLKRFKEVVQIDTPIGIAGVSEDVRPFALRVGHNDERGELQPDGTKGPLKGGVRFISAGMLMGDEVFRERFNELRNAKARGGKPRYTIQELRHFLHKWVEEETRALAIGMSIKNAVGDLPYGGAKGTILFCDVVQVDGELVLQNYPTTDPAFRARVVRSYARDLYERGKIGPNRDVPAPDTGSTPNDMDLMNDELVKALVERAVATGEINEWTDGSFRAEMAQILQESRESPHQVTEKRFLAAVARKMKELRDVQNIRGKASMTGPDGPNKVPAWLRPYAQVISTFTSKSVQNAGSEFRNDSTGRGVVRVLKNVLVREDGLKARLRDEVNPEGVQKKVTDERPLEGLTFSIMGLGGVGIPAALEILDEGGIITTISEGPNGIIHNPKGFTAQQIRRIIQIKNSQYSLKNGIVGNPEFTGTVFLEDTAAFYRVPVDVYIPCALENVVNETNVDGLSAKIIAEGANGAVTNEAYYRFLARETNPGFVVSDSLSNKGGVTTSYLEWIQNNENEQWSADEVRGRQYAMQDTAVEAVYAVRAELGVDLRTAVDVLAFRRILAARGGARLATAPVTAGEYVGHPDVEVSLSLLSRELERQRFPSRGMEEELRALLRSTNGRSVDFRLVRAGERLVVAARIPDQETIHVYRLYPWSYPPEKIALERTATPTASSMLIPDGRATFNVFSASAAPGAPGAGDGRLVTVGNDGRMRLFDAFTGRVIPVRNRRAMPVPPFDAVAAREGRFLDEPQVSPFGETLLAPPGRRPEAAPPSRLGDRTRRAPSFRLSDGRRSTSSIEAPDAPLVAKDEALQRLAEGRTLAVLANAPAIGAERALAVTRAVDRAADSRATAPVPVFSFDRDGVAAASAVTSDTTVRVVSIANFARDTDSPETAAQNARTAVQSGASVLISATPLDPAAMRAVRGAAPQAVILSSVRTVGEARRSIAAGADGVVFVSVERLLSNLREFSEFAASVPPASVVGVAGVRNSTEARTLYGAGATVVVRDVRGVTHSAASREGRRLAADARRTEAAAGQDGNPNAGARLAAGRQDGRNLFNTTEIRQDLVRRGVPRDIVDERFDAIDRQAGFVHGIVTERGLAAPGALPVQFLAVRAPGDGDLFVFRLAPEPSGATSLEPVSLEGAVTRGVLPPTVYVADSLRGLGEENFSFYRSPLNEQALRLSVVLNDGSERVYDMSTGRRIAPTEPIGVVENLLHAARVIGQLPAERQADRRGEALAFLGTLPQLTTSFQNRLTQAVTSQTAFDPGVPARVAGSLGIIAAAITPPQSVIDRLTDPERRALEADRVRIQSEILPGSLTTPAALVDRLADSVVVDSERLGARISPAATQVSPGRRIDAALTRTEARRIAAAIPAAVGTAVAVPIGRPETPGVLPAVFIKFGVVTAPDGKEAVRVKAFPLDNRLAVDRAVASFDDIDQDPTTPLFEPETLERSALLDDTQNEQRQWRLDRAAPTAEELAKSPSVSDLEAAKVPDARTIAREAVAEAPYLAGLPEFRNGNLNIFNALRNPNVHAEIAESGPGKPFIIAAELAPYFDTQYGFIRTADFLEGTRMVVSQLERSGSFTGQNQIIITFFHQGELDTKVGARIAAQLDSNQRALGLGQRVRFALVTMPKEKKLADGIADGIQSQLGPVQPTGMSIGYDYAKGIESVAAPEDLKNLNRSHVYVYAIKMPGANETVSFAGTLCVSVLKVDADFTIPEELRSSITRTTEGGIVILLVSPHPITPELAEYFLNRRFADISA